MTWLFSPLLYGSVACHVLYLDDIFLQIFLVFTVPIKYVQNAVQMLIS